MAALRPRRRNPIHPAPHVPGNKGGGGRGGGGGKGGGGKGGGKKPRRKLGPLESRARRDVMLSVRPELQDIRRARRQGTREYHTASNRVGDIYGGLQHELAPLGAQYGNQANDIAGDFTTQLGGLTDLLGSNVQGVPQGEISAGTGLFGTIGAGALEQLAGERGRNLAYNASAQRQGGIEKMTGQRNMLSDLQDFRKDLSQQRLDVTRGTPADIRQRLDELRDAAFQRQLAEKQFGLQARSLNQGQLADQAFQNYLIDQARTDRNRGRRRR